ncbi:hypothetical protein BV20DRAFT_241993 [Pilatotrama ljubarskyi]|nr:hypothetical protein BV20DRAFT_241993 [Pilatotrama ljubarskyi]
MFTKVVRFIRKKRLWPRSPQARSPGGNVSDDSTGSQVEPSQAERGPDAARASHSGTAGPRDCDAILGWAEGERDTAGLVDGFLWADDELEVRGLSITDACCDTVAALERRARWNASLPINRLPVELLVSIFILLPTRSTDRYEYRWKKPTNITDWGRVMGVCRHWHEVIRDHACFWQSAVVRKRTDWLQLILDRSRDSYLYLTFLDTPTFLAVLPCLLPLKHRIKSFQAIQRWDSNAEGLVFKVASLSGLLDHALPALTRLVVINSRLSPAPTECLILNPLQYPNLSYLELAHALDVPWTTSLLSKLTTLVLHQCRLRASHSSMDQFFEVLQHGEHLRTLELKGVLETILSGLSTSSRPAIFLPHLRELTIDGSSAQLSQFTTSVQLPSQGNVHLTESTGLAEGHIANVNPTPAMYEVFMPARPEGWRILQAMDHVSLDVDAGSYHLSCSNPQLRISVLLGWKRFPAESPIQTQRIYSAIRHMLARLGALPITYLSLRLDLNLVDDLTLDMLLDAFPKLQTLDIQGPGVQGSLDPTSLLRSLATSSTSPTSDLEHSGVSCEQVGRRSPEVVAQVRCRQLQYMSLRDLRWNHGKVMEALSECLRMRAQRGAAAPHSIRIGVIRVDSGEEWRGDSYYAEQLHPFVSNPWLCSFTSEVLKVS